MESAVSDTIDWDAIENFIGFGNANAEVLFLGMEEGLSPGVALEDDLKARAGYAQYEDLYDAQSLLEDCGRFFGPAPLCQRTWRPMCHLMLRRETNEPLDNKKRTRYQADRLGRRDGQTLLAELLPYPNPNTGTWLYGPYGRPSRAELVERRIALLKEALQFANFKIAVAYGTGNWMYYRNVFPSIAWKQHGCFLVGNDADTRFVLTPHFSTRAFNTEAQLDAFAEVCLRGE
jgi:hypothetical protein